MSGFNLIKNEILDAIKRRRSVRAYELKKVPREIIDRPSRSLLRKGHPI